MQASWKAPLALLSGATLAFWTACWQSPPAAPPPPPPPAPAASTGSAAAVTVAPAPAPPPPAEALAPLLRRGPLHHAPIALPGGKGPPRWLVLLGEAEAARSAWILQPGASPAIAPLGDFPLAVRVAGQRTQGSTLYLEVVSVAAGDLPGGLRALVPIDGPSGQISDREWASLLGVEALAGLDAYLSQARSSATYTLPDEDPTEATLAALLPADGAEVFTTWPSLAWRRAGRLVPGSLAASPALGPTLALLRSSGLRCTRSLCEAHDLDGALLGRVLLDMEGDRVLVRRVLLAPPPPERSARPARMRAREQGRQLAEALRPVVAGVRALIAEAPFSAAGGTVGLATVSPEDGGDNGKGLTLAVSEGPLTRLFDIEYLSSSETPIEVGFADIDGDGYTDVVTRTPGKGERTPMVLLVPPASRQLEAFRIDAASIFPLREARSLDDAIGRALAIPSRGLRSEEACPLLTGRRPAGARLFEYTEPNIFDTGRTMRPISAAQQRELQGTEPPCAAPLLCSPTRPVCRDHGENNPALSYYWFGWPKGQLTLVAQADYGGS